MKKLLLFLIIVCLGFILGSCGKDKGESETGSNVPSNEGGENTGSETQTPTVVPPTPVESQIALLLKEAESLQSGESLEGDRTVTGTVKEFIETYTTQYKNVSFILTDGTAEVKVWRAKGECAATLKVGDTVTVTGEVINYSGTIEIQYGSLSVESTGTEDGVVTIKSILDEAASLTDGQTLAGTRKTVGTVKEFKETYTTQYKNVSFVLTDGESEIIVWRAKGDCAASLAVGDKVYVEGEVINYGGKIEIQYGALTTGNESNGSTVPAELMTIAQVLDAAKDLTNGAALPGTYKTSGVVSNFEKKSSYNGGDYYQFNITDGTNKILVYKPVGAIVEQIKNGDTVYVKGSVKNYNGTIEFDAPEVSFGDDFDKTNVEKLTDAEKTPVVPSQVTGTYDFISLPMALAIARDGGENFESKEKYYITGWVTNVNNYSYGSITITDGNVTIFAYGISGYAKNGEWPVEGDVVVVEAVIGTNGTDVELKNASKLVEWHKVEVDQTQYTAATILQARNANAGDKLIVEGVVAAFTYKNAKTSNGEYVRDGFYLVNGADTILIHGSGVASTVEIGNTVKVAGVKEFFVQESEISLAAKYGFPGACQLSSAKIVSNDKGKADYRTNNFEEATMKELMSCEYDENITNQVFTVRAVIQKANGTGFVNYYINDLDLTTGTYTYTKCNGNDFAWLDQYLDENGQYLCDLLVTVCNAKATSSGCVWRVIPLAILGNATFDVEEETLDFVYDYYVAPQFETTYYANPATELVTTHASEFLGYTGVTVEYASSNEEVVKVEVVDGKTVLNVNAVGQATLTITVKMGDETLVKTVTIVREGEPTFDSLTVAEAIAANVDALVTVEGIVGPSLVNQTGFYLIDETGVIAVRTTKETLATLKQGNRVVLEGTRGQNNATETMPGQAMVTDAELVHNYYGENAYSTASFQTSTLAELATKPTTEDWTTQVYVVEATAYASGYVAVIKNGETEITLYVSGAAQYKWLTDIAAQYEGQMLTMEVALCNWNKKNPYKAAVLAVYLPDGTKVINSLNFS